MSSNMLSEGFLLFVGLVLLFVLSGNGGELIEQNIDQYLHTQKYMYMYCVHFSLISSKHNVNTTSYNIMILQHYEKDIPAMLPQCKIQCCNMHSMLQFIFYRDIANRM